MLFSVLLQYFFTKTVQVCSPIWSPLRELAAGMHLLDVRKSIRFIKHAADPASHVQKCVLSSILVKLLVMWVVGRIVVTNLPWRHHTVRHGDPRSHSRGPVRDPLDPFFMFSFEKNVRSVKFT